MYRRHKAAVIVLFVVVLVTTYLAEADYGKIAETAVAVIAIALAVYVGAASVILGSDFAQKLKSQRDDEIKTKTSLGVLAAYLRVAGVCSLATIAISVFYVLDLNVASFFSWAISGEDGICVLDKVSLVISALSCGLFSINIVFIWLILIFLINSMTKSV